MKLTVHPSSLQGTVVAPPSKSVFQRVVAASLLSKSTTRLTNPCFVDDGLASLSMAGALGATIEEDGEDLIVTGGYNPRQEFLEAGESGLGIRLFTPLTALHHEPLEIRAGGSLTKRPMNQLADPLREMGAQFESTDGFAPLKVCGPLKPGTAHVDGSLSSQYVTGMLMALATLDGDSVMNVSNAKSTPYIDMTIEVMAAFGVDVIHKNYERFDVFGNQVYECDTVHTPGDWSAGAMLLVAAAISGGGLVRVAGLDNSFTQADQSIAGAMLFAGCKLANEPDGIRVTAHKIRGFKFDATDCPDLFPPLAALACYADKPSEITGIHRLASKESDRALALQSELGKVGIKVELKSDVMIIHPGPIQPAEIDSHEDHRIAMALALIALGGASITIAGAECVSKSYPEFWDDISDLGAQVVPVG